MRSEFVSFLFDKAIALKARVPDLVRFARWVKPAWLTKRRALYAACAALGIATIVVIDRAVMGDDTGPKVIVAQPREVQGEQQTETPKAQQTSKQKKKARRKAKKHSQPKPAVQQPRQHKKSTPSRPRRVCDRNGWCWTYF